VTSDSDGMSAGARNPQECSSVSMNKRIGLTAAGVAAAGGVVLGAASLASADPATPAPSTSAGPGATSEPGPRGRASNDTAVTGAELAKVTAAMKAKDSAVTVTTVRKDPDGSYDVLGTKSGANVFYDVSADLSTFTLNAHGGGK
jgi:hypothetical protein